MINQDINYESIIFHDKEVLSILVNQFVDYELCQKSRKTKLSLYIASKLNLSKNTDVFDHILINLIYNNYKDNFFELTFVFLFGSLFLIFS